MMQIANGGGITVNSGEGNKTWNFEATGDNFGSSENINEILLVRSIRSTILKS